MQLFTTTGKSNVPMEMSVPNHPGSDVIYSWDFDDGQREDSTSSVISHTFTSPGVYVVNVTAHNDISEDSAQVSCQFQKVISITIKSTVHSLPELILFEKGPVKQGT